MTILRASQATYVRSDKASSPQYTAAKSTLQVEASSPTRQAFLYFPLPNDIKGKTVTSAVVRLTAASSVPSPTYTLVRHAASGSYSKMTYNNRPAALGGAANVTGTKSGAVWSFDVSVDVAAWAAGGAYYGFRLTTSDTTLRQFTGPQASSGYPVLEYTYSAVPAAPSGVAPSGGYASVAKPWVTWQAADDIDLVQVQLDTVGSTWDKTTGFASPTFDSGSLSSTTGQIDLSATAFAGLAANAQTDMTVRQHGSLGWSAWSLPVTWGYAARPAVVLTNPGASSGDPTPPHTWTVTPSGQLSWQLLVLNADGRVLYDSTRTAGADLSATPTAGPQAAGATATSVLRIVDRSDRVATLGQPAYTEATKAWTYDPNLALLPADAVHVSQVGKTPKIEVQIARSAPPDEWLVQIGDATPIRFDFDENTAGSNWLVGSWECPPNTPTEVTVTPIENNVAGKSYTETITTEVSGMWLVDPVTEANFSLAGGDSGSESMATSAATFTPIGGSRVIVRTQALRGLEGSIDGELWDYDGRTVAEQAADVEALRLLSVTRELRQIKGTTNIAVVATNLSLVDNVEAMVTVGRRRDARKVRWDFYQTDFDDGGLFSGELG